MWQGERGLYQNRFDRFETLVFLANCIGAIFQLYLEILLMAQDHPHNY